MFHLLIGCGSTLSSQPFLLSFFILSSLPGYNGPKFRILLYRKDLRSITERFIYCFSCNMKFSYLYSVDI